MNAFCCQALKWLLPKKLFIVLLGTLVISSTSIADESFVWAPEYSIGDQFPDFSILDHAGSEIDKDNASGDKGYLLVFNRSVVW